LETRFEGLYPAVITPMSTDGSIDEAVFRQVIEFNIRAGVHGFWVAGGTGESVLLDDEENRRLAEIVVDQAAGRANVIMHVGAPTTRRAAALAAHAAGAGVEAICCVPPFFYRRSDAEIVDHYRAVGAAAGRPLFIYNLPSATGVEITPGLMGRIQDGVPQVAGLKHSAPTMGHVRAFTKMGLACMIGNCRLVLPALTLGASGCVDGPICMLPELWVRIWGAYQDADLRRAEGAQDRACTVLEGFQECGGGFHAMMKGVLSARLGVPCGDPRPPGVPLSEAQREAIEQRVEALDLRVDPAS